MAFKVFKKGTSGGMVKDAQKALAKRLKTKIKGDGKFGPATEEHIKAFQKKFRLKTDGLLGPKTMAALMPAASKPSPEQLKAVKKLKAQSAQARKTLISMKKEIDNFDKLISTLESNHDLVSRRETMTAFESFDQKSNQLFNILASVLKAIKDMKAGVARNFL